MIKDVWSIVVKSVTAVRGPVRRWLLRPIVTVVASIAIAVVTAGYSLVVSAVEIWNSDTWSDDIE